MDAETARESANERYERLAALFHAETGLMAPGKDVPAALTSMLADDYRARLAAWQGWLADYYAGLEADRARLDWLCDNAVFRNYPVEPEDVLLVVGDRVVFPHDQRADFRAAIDAQMGATPSPAATRALAAGAGRGEVGHG